MSNDLTAVQMRLATAVARLERVQQLYLREGTTAGELYEAERLGHRASGIAYALSVIDEAIDTHLSERPT